MVGKDFMAAAAVLGVFYLEQQDLILALHMQSQSAQVALVLHLLRQQE